MPTYPLSRGLVRMLAVIIAVTIANLYYAQPLLHAIAVKFGVSSSVAGLVVTATQVGYAAGLLFVVPLGDIVRLRPLLSALLGLDALVLAASAFAPSLLIFGTLALVIGLSSVVVQMIVPYAANLASDEERSGVIGTLIGGLLIGILLSRTFAGVAGGVIGLRGVYLFAALLMAATSVGLYRLLPAASADLQIGFASQMRAVVHVARTEAVLRWRSAMGACAFGAFTCFWTTVTFLLTGPPYHLSEAQIGLFALVGAAGAATAVIGGRLLNSRRHLRWQITGATFALLVASFGLIYLGEDSLGWLIAGVLLMDACVQAINVTNQSVVYDLQAEARSRITTIYITSLFVGGAAGSAIGSQAYGRWGWTGAAAVAGAFALAGLACWAASGRHERTPATTPTSAEPKASSPPAQDD